MPLARHGAGVDGVGWIPASSVTNGEGKEGEKHEGLEGYQWVVLVGVGTAGKGLAGITMEGAAVASGGGGAPAAVRGGRGVGELHGC